MVTVTTTEIRRVLSALPETEELVTWDSETFRVRNKIFAVIHPSGQKITLKTKRGTQAILVATDPKTYEPAAYTGRFGWVTVQLSSACVHDLHDLIVEAWRQTAPKSLVASYDSEGSH
ncbi:MAG: MmcQ/YjbR family DNA-binding protein [Pseudonocardiaceae bacterium]